jgi:glycosyltransferase involved in cell wall biosynthesis
MRALCGDRQMIRVHTLIDGLGWGGAEKLVTDMCDAAHEAGIEASVGYFIDVAGNSADAGIRARGIALTHVPVTRVLDPSGARHLRRHLMEIQPDLVHTHLPTADTLGTVAAASLGIPSVSTIHSVADHESRWWADEDRRTAARLRLAALVRRHSSARVIAVSDAARDAYVATGWDTRRHVVTVRNGIAWVAPREAAAVRVALGLGTTELVVTTVSVLRPGKGHALAIDAVRRLLPRHPSLRLVIVGEGPERERIRRLAAPLKGAVLMVGHRDDVMDILAATDVLIHPATIDAFPTVLLEAAAAGVPVLATRVGGIPEIVEDGRSGLLVGPSPTVDQVADKLSSLLADAALRQRLGKHARAVFEQQFTAGRWLQRLREVYDEVLAERADRPVRARGIR